MSKTRSRRVSLLFSILAVPALSVNVAAQVAQFNFAQLTLNNGFSAPAGVGVDASGNIYVADTGNNAVKEVAPGCILAGCAVTLGSGFKGPSAIAVDASGNVFVADTGNHAVKEMLAVNGSIPASPTINTLGSGFSSPVAVAVDQGGNVYVADQGNGTVKEIPAAGGFTSVTTLGSSFSSPSGVAVDVSGDVFVTDSSKNIVQEIVAVGGSIPASPTINTLAGGFSRPAGVAVDGSGDVFVADSGNGLVKELVAVSGSIPASASVIDFGAGLGTPTGIALGSNGTIYTADPKNNNAVVLETQAVNLGTVAVNSDSGTFSLVFSFTSGGALGAPGLLTMGTGGLDFEVLSNGTTCAAGSVSAGSTCTFKVYFNPRVAGERNGAAVLYDASTPANVLATVYLHGIGSGPVLSFPPGAISAIAGNGTQGFNNDNIAATSAELNSPGSVALDGAGDTYIADTGNERIREVSASSGLISTVAGSGTGCGSQTDSLGDGCPATSATLSSPAAVALDGAGNLYIADKGNQRIRVVNASTGVIETVAGGGTGCAAQTDASGDGCAATDAKLSNPSGIALDGAGNLYIADTQDGAVRVVSAATGIISEIAAVSSPAGVALDTAGNLYISESSAALVQELNLQTGAVATVAGGGIGCADESDPLGDGCPATAAKLNSPGGIALDPGGDLYIADQPAGVIRAVSASTGLISTAAGGGTGCTGQTDSVGDGCPSTSALIAPAGIAVYPNGNIVIADSTGQLVRKVDVADAPPLVFPSTPVASVSSTLYVTPESIGNQPLIEDGFDFFGDNFGLDETNTTCTGQGKPLATGSSCTLGITFGPRATGPVSSMVTFAANTGTGGTNIPVSGTGLPEVTPPAPVITSNPAQITIATTATFTFTDAEDGVNFECSLDEVPYSPCQSGITYTALGVGDIHTFYVEAIDILGTYGAGTPYTWEVVAPPPFPTFTNGPASTTTLTTAFITFTDTQVGVTFLCSLDSALFAPCTSGVKLSGLAVGAHTFAVEAQAGPGIINGTATLVWTINPPPPPTPVAAPATSAATNFGTVPVGQTSSTSTINFTFSLGGTIGSISALTSGAPNLDFALLSTGTCVAGQAFATGTSCTVNATFTPRFAGSRYGAAVLEDAYGNVIGTGYLQGTGSGPQASFSPYTQTSLGGGFDTPAALAVDGLGNVYVADETDAVKVIPPGCASASCTTTIGQGFLGVTAPVVDGAGNVFVVEQNSGSLLEIAPGCTSENCVTTLSTTLSTPVDVAVDGSGNVYVADAGPQAAGDQTASYPNGSIKQFVASSGYATVNVLSTGINFLTGVAVDSAGNVFISLGDDKINSAIEEIPAAGGYASTNSLYTALYAPVSIHVDSVGNLYFIDSGNAALRMLSASSGYTTATTVVSYAGSPSIPYGIALDAGGNIYTAIPSAQGGGVFKLDYADPPTLSFATTSVGLTDTVDGTESVALQNIGNATLNLTTVTPPSANFNIVSTATTCTNSSTVAQGTSCTVGVQFAPTASGKLAGTVTFTDNALNVSGSAQAVNLAGAGDAAAGPPPAPTITSQPSNPSGSAAATFAFTDTQSAVTFLCSLDGADYTACTSGVSYSSLANGAHVFGVRAADALNDQSAVTSYSWNITALPVPDIDQAPANPTTITSASFVFSDAQQGGSFVCSLDGAAYSACTSGIAYSSLADGSHTFAVEFENSSSVLSAPAIWTWTIASTLAFQPGSAQNFGTIPVGQTSSTITLAYTFTAAATLGTPVALSEGAQNLDFAVTGGSCTSGASFASGNTCTISLTFSPKTSGLRRGVILLTDNSANTVASIYVYGIGSGPQVLLLTGYAFGAGSETSIGGGFSRPQGIAVDGAGNTYVADEGNNAVKKIPAGCASTSCVVTLGTGLTSPAAIAVDGGGNVYVAEEAPSAVLEIPYGCTSNSCFVNLGGGFFGPQGVAVDASGNVFVADYVNNAVKEMPPGCASAGCVTTINSTLTGPEAIAVDSNDNVFVIQYGLSSTSDSGTTGCNGSLCISNTVALMELPVGGYSNAKTLQSSFNSPIFLALDGNANAYITEWASGIGEVQEWIAATGYTQEQSLNFNCGSSVAGSLCDRSGVAVDGSGNVYVGDSDSNSVLKMSVATPQTLTFPTPTGAGAADYNDATEAAFLLNNGNAPLNFSSISAGANFLVFDYSAPCSTSTPLSPGSLCAANVIFTPTTSGPITGTLTFTDNNLNAADATQQVPLAGTGLPSAPTITSGPANGADTGTVTFAFTDSVTTVASYLCSLDGSAYATCSTGVSYSNIAVGNHTFSVEAKDSFGNLSAAASWAWTEAQLGGVPTPVLTSTPTNPTASTSNTFTFTDAEPGVLFYCLLFDSTTVTFQDSTCISGVTFTTVAGNSYELSLFAADNYGNVSSTVTYSWSVAASVGPPQPPPPPLPTLTSGNFGSEPIAQTTAPITLPLSFTSYGTGTIGSIQALTHGAPNLDFAVAPGGTCEVGAAYTAATICTVNVTFTPTLAGWRRGGVVIRDSAGNVLAEAYIQGVGTGPQAGFLPGIISTFASGFSQPEAVTADGAGNIYIWDYVSGTATSIQKYPVGCHQASCSIPVGGTVGGMSIDGLGNIVIGGYSSGTGIVYIDPPGCNDLSCMFQVGANYQYPDALYGPDSNFIDGAGNLYIADVYQYYGVYETYASDSYATPHLLVNSPSEIGGPEQIVADVNGNMFVAAAWGGGWEITAGCTEASCLHILYPPAIVDNYAQNFVYGVGADGVGNAYFSDVFQTPANDSGGNHDYVSILENTVASGYSTSIPVTPQAAFFGSLAMDDPGNLYLPATYATAQGTNNVEEVDFNTPPTLTFPTPTPAGTADTTDGALTATIKNNGNGSMTFYGFAVSNASFKVDSASTTCSTSMPLAAQATCNVGVTFSPTSVGTLTGTLIVSDDSLNLSTNTQLLPLSGTGTGTSPLTATTTKLAATSNSITAGASVTFTATVTPNSGTVTATGTVTFIDGAIVLGTGSLNGSGVATFTTSNLAVGSQSIVASYGGDSKNSASTSTAVTVTVAPTVGSTTTKLSASSTLLPANSTLTLTAQVLPASLSRLLTGTVTFYDGAISIGTGTLNTGGVATLTTVPLTAGTHGFKAVYGGDTYDTASTSLPVSVVIRPVVNTITVLQSSANAIETSSYATFTATVTPASGSNIPTGVVNFLDGTTPIGAATLNSSGVATITVNTLGTGANSITASYGGDTYNNPSTSAPVNVAVSAFVTPTTTQLSTSSAAIPAGGSVTLTAAVVPTKGTVTPTGSVVFFDGSQPLCTVTLNTNAAATCTPTFTQRGTHFITASYGGDSGDLSSVSPVLAINVGADPSQTTLQASANSVPANNPVTLLANVRPTVGGGIPTGTVTFIDGSTTLGTGTLNSRGSASFTTSALTVGIHTLAASYGGDSNNLASSSGSVFVSVTILSTDTELTASASAIGQGASVTFTASVLPSSGTGTPTGTVTFTDGTTTLGTRTLSSGGATFTTSTLALGSHSITAFYGGDPKDSSSTSGTVVVTVSATSVSTTTALQSSKNSLTYGGSVTFTATVTPASGNVVPTGTVTFTDGSTTLGSGSLNGSGIATFSTTFLPVGTQSITANYGGDSKNNASASTPVSVKVSSAPAPVLSLAPLSLVFTAANGSKSTAQTATLTNTGNAALTINGINILGADPGGFKETSNCGSTLAAGASCTISVVFAPSSVAGYQATLSVSDNATGSPHTAALSGTGTVPPAPVVSLTPPSMTFTAYTGATGTAQTATLMNTGNAALTISGISFTGANPSDFAETSTCGSSLAAGSSCTISVTFTPASATTFSASLSVADNAAGSPHTVALSGTGSTPPAPVVSLTPPSLTFTAYTGATSGAQTATLMNTGNAALTISGISITGANPTDFAETTTCGSSLPAGSSCSISVTFTPASATTLSANLSVADNAAGSPHTVALSGTGNTPPAPVASLTPASLTFTAVTGATSAAQSATLSNTGNAPLTITGISFTGADPTDFAQTNNCGSSLAAGANCSISVTFTPASAAALSATLSIADNASGSPQTVSLSGTGTAPPSFTISSPAPAQSITPGGTATYTITATPQNGAFDTAISFAVTGLPTGASASFNPPTVTPGSNPASTTLTISDSLVTASRRPFKFPIAPPAAALAALVLFFLPGKRRRRKLWLGLLFLASLGAFTALSACGGGYGSPVPPQTTYSVTVTATGGSVQETTTLQLTVQQ